MDDNVTIMLICQTKTEDDAVSLRNRSPKLVGIRKVTLYIGLERIATFMHRSGTRKDHQVRGGGRAGAGDGIVLVKKILSRPPAVSHRDRLFDRSGIGVVVRPTDCCLLRPLSGAVCMPWSAPDVLGQEPTESAFGRLTGRAMRHHGGSAGGTLRVQAQTYACAIVHNHLSIFL
jgi:hypothetical protein